MIKYGSGAFGFSILLRMHGTFAHVCGLRCVNWFDFHVCHEARFFSCCDSALMLLLRSTHPHTH